MLIPAPEAPNRVNGYSPSNPSIAGTDGSQPRRANLAETTCVLCNAQAACGFSCSASKCSSFFQSVKTIAAIFRPKVRRFAISGFIPLGQRTQIDSRVTDPPHSWLGSRPP